MSMQRRTCTTLLLLAAAFSAAGVAPVQASSHMDAPLITLDPAANTTDVYAFVTGSGAGKQLVLALGVYPHQEPGVGPNKYNFDDNVLYEIHVATGADVAAGAKSLSYQFRFTTSYLTEMTILQSYLGPVAMVADPNQNLVQNYNVTKVDHSAGVTTMLGSGVVPPNNQGIATPFYNQGDNGESPAKPGVATAAQLDSYTQEAVVALTGGYQAFAGQRDDGFYGDIQSIFDLLSLRDPGIDSQGGFNIHLMALSVPMAELGGDQQVVGVYATTSRQKLEIVRDAGDLNDDQTVNVADAVYLLNALFANGPMPAPQAEPVWRQVGRQGNPLFCEGLVAIADKDLYNQSSPTTDMANFSQYALTPELGVLINVLLLGGSQPGIGMNRTDLVGIFIPDLIKVDLSTPAARLAGGGATHPTNPDDAGFSRLSIFGGDVLASSVQDPFQNGGFIPGGWPNGRRFGDDVVDIAVDAILSDLTVLPPVINTFAPGDGVAANDAVYSRVFPYESTPQNGRNHTHP
ncbi:MAG: DUF4331 domain-containing protein [Planctomycetota bacterium]